MDAAKLDAAVAFAKAHETNWPQGLLDTGEDLRIAARSDSRPAAPRTNGLVIRNGYVVAEFGDTNAADPTYSVAKSMLATVAGVAVREGLIKNLDAPVGSQIKDGGYDSPQNAKVTWRHHLQQESEWEGEMWGKKHDFVGTVAFGDGERKPRDVQDPGTFYEYNDVRINRFSLSLLRLFKKPVPDVFRDEVMNVIGASDTWQWIPVQEQLRRRGRQEGRVGERRHAVGRRRVDQFLGHGAVRLSVAARRPLGRRSRSCRRPTSRRR